MKKSIVLLIGFLSLVTGYAQNINPIDDVIFNENEVAVLRLAMDPADKAFLLDDENIWSNVYLPASFEFKNSIVDTSLIFDVGIRLRGNTSRNHPKRSFKIKFKEFGGEKFFDYKKFNLKAQNNDPTMVRQLLILRLFREANIAGTQSHHVEVYINDEYMGLYLNVEQIDDEFVQARFGNDDGNLYKCSWGASLRNDAQINDNGIFELKTNEEFNDRSILSNFISVLNQTPDTQFEEAIESVFNVESYLKYLAIEVLSGHWDGYSYNKNNFYLYENSESGLVEFIPYDVDNTFGINWIDRDWGTRDVLDWTNHGDPRPLTSRILDKPRYLSLFKKELDQLLKGNFSEAYFFPEFDKYKILLTDPISRDAYFSLKFGYSFEDFENGFVEQVVNHAPYGLKPYVTTRTSTARIQLGEILGNYEKTNNQFHVYPNPSNGRSLTIVVNKQVNEILILDVSGREYSFGMTRRNNSTYQLDFKLNEGLYILRLDGVTTSKFVVN